MYYKEEIDYILRFGDVIKGKVIATSNIIKGNYSLDLDFPDYAVLLTPCCSIDDKDKKITLSPLNKINPTFLQNPYFKEDLTRLNIKIKPKYSVPPEIWNEKMNEEERQRRIADGEQFAFVNLFIYEKHDLLSNYKIITREKHEIQTNFYMINFKNNYSFLSDKLKSPGNKLLKSKILQLSKQTRMMLRDKISFFYGRPPKEDIIEI